MDINLSLEHYEEFYKLALAAQEQAHVAPKCLRRVEELQLRCRICGCLDDGSFVDLDAVQDFEFEPSICSYRELFQRTSLHNSTRCLICRVASASDADTKQRYFIS
ncbi:uncharacterized protein LOC132798596 isoform X3 [Drosophila nasuta]|uniref:uncharacterized protein LOC132798596 isoform X3 n=1 Tax=Drosophila nasuta TaxID=42062 RepID=UPI00295F413B|nr:uncharacterized protein LOC132798596 isoform X3 [Drosophila nasuta]